MMRRTVLASALAILCSSSGALAGPGLVPVLPTWSVLGPSGSRIVEIAEDGDGARIFATGTRSNGSKAWLGAYEADTGTEAWSFTSSRSSMSHGVAVTPDGERVAIAGWVTKGGERQSKISIWMFDASNGSSLWSAIYTGDGADRGDAAFDLTFAPNGRTLYVTGTVWNDGRRRDMAVLAYNAASGAARWRRAIHLRRPTMSSPSEEGLAIAVSGDGTRVIVSGYRDRPAGESRSRAVTLGLAAADGATKWIADSTPEGVLPADANAGIDLAVHGSAVFVGGVARYSDAGSFAAKHPISSGARTWAQLYAPDDASTARAMAIAADAQHAYLAGAVRASTGSIFRVWAQAADSGALRWVTSEQLRGTAYDVARPTTGARVYAGGSLLDAGNNATFSIAGFDASTGSLEWLAARQQGETQASEQVSSIVFSADGSQVFAGGNRREATNRSLLAAFPI